MFFESTTKLKEEIEAKDKHIERLQSEIKSLKLKSKEEIKALTQELNIANAELERLTRELNDLKSKVEETVNFDLVSGANNQRYFYDVAESIVSLSKREKSHLSLAVLYIDKFDKINEIYGFDKGNEILQLFVHSLSAQIRESDVFVRLEGAKFVILLPNTSKEQAIVISEKLRKTIEICRTADEIRFTASIGIAEFNATQDNIVTLLQKAEDVLSSKNSSTGNTVAH